MEESFTPKHLKKILRKLTKKRRFNDNSFHFIKKIIFYTTSFLVLMGTDSTDDENFDKNLIKTKNLKKIFIDFQLEELFDEAYEQFLNEYVKNK